MDDIEGERKAILFAMDQTVLLLHEARAYSAHSIRATISDLDKLEAVHPHARLDHLRDMYVRCKENEDWPLTKLYRWLGWMQACAVLTSGRAITLENMKALNRLARLDGTHVEVQEG